MSKAETKRINYMKPRFKVFIAILTMGSFMACGTGETQKASPSSASSNVAEQNTPLGQASVQDDISAANILQVAIESPDHTTLVAAVQAANIENVLVNAGPLTVFAPNNAAFNKLPEGTVEELLKPENKAKLAGILTRHAAPGSFDSDGLKKEASKGRKIYMANGDYLSVRVEGDDIYVGGAKILATIPTSNGIINVVDAVILSAE